MACAMHPFEMLDVDRDDVYEDGNSAFAKHLERGSQHTRHGVIGFDACEDHSEPRTCERLRLTLGWPGSELRPATLMELKSLVGQTVRRAASRLQPSGEGFPGAHTAGLLV